VEVEVEAWGASGWMTWPKSLNPEASAVVGRLAMEAEASWVGGRRRWWWVGKSPYIEEAAVVILSPLLTLLNIPDFFV
jgi:hypothetical protein